MTINNELIKKAMKFYEIEDEEYIYHCYECINFINKNASLKNKVNELYQLLYFKIDEASKLWNIKNINELFGEENHPYITNVLLLSGYEIHIKNMKKYNFDEAQIKTHKKRVRESFTNDIYIRHYQGIRISQMLWGTYFINARLIEVGRLQYEYVKSKKEEFIKIHIPKGSKLNNESVKISLNNSQKEIKKYFHLDNPKYYCNSWLLSNQINKMVKSDSNIAKFHDMFIVEDGEECIEDILNFVYEISECTSYDELPERTSLQREIKRWLIEGKKIYIGKGNLKQRI